MLHVVTLEEAARRIHDRFGTLATGTEPVALSEALGRRIAADVVAANVLGPILIRFAKEIAALVKPSGKLILSGILDELYPEVAAAYEALGFRETDSELIGEWRTGLFCRP